MDDIIKKLIDSFIEEKLQECAYIVGDIVNSRPREDLLFLLVVMRNLVDSALPRLSDSEQELFKILRERSVVLTLPPELDPRKRDGK